MKIVYDGTYMLKGNSGIPSDAKSTLNCLSEIENVEIDVIFFDFLHKRRNKSVEHNQIGGSRFTPQRIFKGVIGRSYKYAVIFFRKIKIVQRILPGKIELNNSSKIKSSEIPSIVNTPNVHYFDSRKTSLRRFLPVLFFNSPLKLDCNDADFYIQQQIDPIKIVSNTKMIIRLHDILPISHPDYFTEKGKKAFSIGLFSLLKNREIIWVMDTEASAKDFKDRFGFFRDVRVVPCVVGEKYKKRNISFSAKKKQFLMVNTIEPRKNVSFVIETFLETSKVSKQLSEFELIIAGNPGWKTEDLVDKLRNNHFGSKVKYFEGLDDAGVADLYTESEFVISASSAEGFGLPPLEGMYFGCIPVISDIPQHRETIDSLGVYFDIEKVSLANALIEASDLSEELKNSYRRKNISYIAENYSKRNIVDKWKAILQES